MENSKKLANAVSVGVKIFKSGACMQNDTNFRIILHTLSFKPREASAMLKLVKTAISRGVTGNYIFS